MNKTAVAAAIAACLSIAAYAGPFDAFKHQVKPGLYESKVDMDMGAMPGMPAGLGKQSHTNQHCITQKDIDDGSIANQGKGKNKDDCQITDVKSSGNTATYKMVCKNATADTKMTFNGNGYVMDMVMVMDQGGHKMTMKTHSESKYLGACK